MRETLPQHSVVKTHIFDNQVGFPPVLADVPLLWIVWPFPCDLPGTVCFLRLGNKVAFQATNRSVSRVPGVLLFPDSSDIVCFIRNKLNLPGEFM